MPYRSPLLAISILFFASFVYAAPPINERSIAGAAEARHSLITAAESFLGTPYRYGGIDRRGLDCSGLIFISFRDGLNITIPRTAENIYSWTARIKAEELKPGDLVFFSTTSPGISHVGIYVGEGKFIHSASEGPNTGVIVSRLDEAYWRRTYHSAGRALPVVVETAIALDEVIPSWSDPGFFAGLSAAWNWGGLSESPFRGVSAKASLGYKWSAMRAGFELRPEWDNAMGVFRLPITLSLGTDVFQVFGGPAYTFGETGSAYKDHTSWLWEIGLSAAFPSFVIRGGTISLYGELAWLGDVEGVDFWRGFMTNIRASTGLRYLRRL